MYCATPQMIDHFNPIQFHSVTSDAESSEGKLVGFLCSDGLIHYIHYSHLKLQKFYLILGIRCILKRCKLHVKRGIFPVQLNSLSQRLNRQVKLTLELNKLQKLPNFHSLMANVSNTIIEDIVSPPSSSSSSSTSSSSNSSTSSTPLDVPLIGN